MKYYCRRYPQFVIILIFIFISIVANAHIYEHAVVGRNPAIKDERDGNYESAFFKTITIINNPDIPTIDKARQYFTLGHFYAHGHGVKINIDSAIYYLNIAADIERSKSLNTYNSLRLLSYIYYNHRYNRIDYNKSLQYLIEAANLGDIKSNFELGELFLSGETYMLKDTIITKTHERQTYNGKMVRERNFSFPYTATDIILHYPQLPIDSVKGYFYYERSYDVNRPILNVKRKLSDIDFIRSYMDGTYSKRDFDKSWEYLSEYTNDEFLNLINISKMDQNMRLLYGEIFWRIQISYRFGLGTRANQLKADYFLDKSTQCGYSRAVDAIK